MPDLSTRTGWRAAPPIETKPQVSGRAWLQAPALGRLLLVLTFWLAVAIAYWPSSKALNLFWIGTFTDEFTHGYLILLVALWFVVRDRRRLAGVALRPVPGAWLLVLALSATWVFLWRAAIQDLHLLMLPLILMAAIVATLGWRAARVLTLPVGLLYFAMPAWDDFSRILQILADKVNGGLIWLSGIPGFMRGNFVQLPSGTLEIAEGCSGMHFLIVGLALATIYGELAGDSKPRRLAWLALMGGLALIGNWIRIFAITVVAFVSEMRSPLVANHYWFGWVIFVLAFLLFLWLAARLTSRWDRAARVGAAMPATGPASDESHVSLRHAAITLLCLAALPGLSYGMDVMRAGSDTRVAIDWPTPPAAWRGPLPVLWSEWAPVYKRASAEAHRRYTDASGRAVGVFMVAYRTQRQSAKLLGYWNSLIGDDGRLRILSEDLVRSPSGVWRQWTMVDAAGTRSVIWSRYRVGDRIFVDGRLSQLWYGIAALTSRPVSSLTAFRAVCASNCAAARSRLASATTALQPTLRLAMVNRGGSAP